MNDINICPFTHFSNSLEHDYDMDSRAKKER